jgi:DNA/RNA-binding protein KIN17
LALGPTEENSAATLVAGVGETLSKETIGAADPTESGVSSSSSGNAGTASASNTQNDGVPDAKPISLKIGMKPQPKNVFAAAKKNALSGGAKKIKIEQPKKMSEAERIMREEMERKRPREFSTSGSSSKRQRM